MAGVITDEVSPVVVGVLYCATILCCQKIFDIRRETGYRFRPMWPPNPRLYRRGLRRIAEGSGDES
jgi:hypothetical protein